MKWIKTKDQLPENHTDVLFLVYYPLIKTYDYIMGSYANGVFYPPECGETPASKVMYWMLCPEPPQLPEENE